MADERASDDVRAINAIVERQFRSLSWSDGKGGDWSRFASDFIADASLYPSGRPAKRQSVDEFVERMKTLAQTSLHSFDERVLGTEIHVFGNVAIAFGACEILENRTKATRGVEAMLLIKDAGAWKIVSQAWDNASDAKPIPPHLVSERASDV